MAQWRTLTRQDLRAFDEDMTKFVLYAMEQGGVGRVSNNGHCIIRNNRGQTMSVSRSASGGNRKQNVARDICRLFGDPNDNPKPSPPKTPEKPQLMQAQPTQQTDEVVRCTVKGCTEQFVTEGARYSHIEQNHYRCREDGCSFVGKTPQSRALHVTRTHRGINPRQNRKQPRPVETVQPAPDSGLAETPEPTAEQPAEAPAPQQPETPPAAEPDTDREQPGWYDRVRVVGESPTVEANRKLLMIREVLGEDPRIAELRGQVDDLRRERDDLKAQLALIRDALALS